MVLTPKESGKLIASLSTNVKVCEDKIKSLGSLIKSEYESGNLSAINFAENGIHPASNDPLALDWLLVVDTLNFCFWHMEDQPGWIVEEATGYFALCKAINRARKEGIDILNPKYYSTISESDLKNILRSDNDVPVPLLQERINNLHEVGQVLIDKFNGSFKNFVESANNSAVSLLNLITENFKCFRDEAMYKGNHVSLYKRAQILVGDIWACFNNTGLGFFKDIDEITMFADYRVPQSLLYFGVLEYSDDLMDRLRRNEIIPNGDEVEVEIRGCSIHAVELIKESINDDRINSVLIDHFLWQFRRKHNQEIVDKKLPFHKTFCIYY